MGYRENAVEISFTKEELEIIKVIAMRIILGPDKEAFAGWLLLEDGRKDAFFAIMERMSDVIHAQGWCEDPDCEYDKNKEE